MERLSCTLNKIGKKYKSPQAPPVITRTQLNADGWSNIESAKFIPNTAVTEAYIVARKVAAVRSN